MSEFLSNKFIENSVEKFSYNEHLLITSEFLLHPFTRCKRDSGYILIQAIRKVFHVDKWTVS